MNVSVSTSERLGNEVPRLQRRSLGRVVVLFILTLHFYAFYWYVHTTRVLNGQGARKISGTFIASCLGMASVSAGLMIAREVLENVASVVTVSQIARWTTALLWLIWTLRIRNRLNEYAEASVQSTVRVSALWSWIFQMFYLQFKINEILDAQLVRTGRPVATPA